jgi:hypothetical protein
MLIQAKDNFTYQLTSRSGFIATIQASNLYGNGVKGTIYINDLQHRDVTIEQMTLDQVKNTINVYGHNNLDNLLKHLEEFHL